MRLDTKCISCASRLIHDEYVTTHFTMHDPSGSKNSQKFVFSYSSENYVNGNILMISFQRRKFHVKQTPYEKVIQLWSFTTTTTKSDVASVPLTSSSRQRANVVVRQDTRCHKNSAQSASNQHQWWTATHCPYGWCGRPRRHHVVRKTCSACTVVIHVAWGWYNGRYSQQTRRCSQRTHGPTMGCTWQLNVRHFILTKK